MQNPRGYLTSTIFDAARRSIATLDTQGNRTSYSYDAANRQTAVMDPILRVNSTIYDVRGLPVVTIVPGSPSAARTTLTYDVMGWKSTERNPDNEVTTTIHDLAGRNTATIDPNGVTTSYRHDAAGRQISMTDGNNRTTSVVYDLAESNAGEHRRVRQTDFDGLQRRWLADPCAESEKRTQYVGLRRGGTRNSVPKSAQSADEPVLRYRRTGVSAGRCAVARHHDRLRPGQPADPTEIFRRDEGQLHLRSERQHDPVRRLDGDQPKPYDQRDLLSAAIEPDGRSITSIYDAASQRTVAIDPVGRTSFSFDGAGRLTGVNNPYGERTTLLYDPAGRQIGQQSPNGTSNNTVYDSAGRPIQIEAVVHLVDWYDLTDDQWSLMKVDGWSILPVSDPAMLLATYIYDPVGNRTSSVELTGDRVSWSYDPTNQLSVETRSGPNEYRHTFTYDPAGNRQTLDDGTDVTTYTYDIADRLQTAVTDLEATTYTFDSCGNLRQIEAPDDVITTFQYDLENRQTSVETEDGITTYIYNALGQRVQRETEDGTTTEFLYDGVNLRQESDSGIVDADYTVAPQPEVQPFGNLLSQRRDSESSFYHFDALGSTVALTDSTQTTTDIYSYEAFGEGLLDTGTTDNPYTFVGRR